MVFINAEIKTMDKKNPAAQAIAVKDGKIIAVGANTEIARFINTDTKTIDVKGKLVLPGFNDSHVHFFSVGAQFFFADLKNTRTPQEIVEKIKHHAEFLPKGNWITGGFQAKDELPLKIMPSKDLIDAATPEHPVLLYIKGVEIVFANSAAFKIAGADKFDADSKATGILRGSAADLIRRAVPANITGDKAKVLETATNYAASVGVTSVQDVHLDDIYDITRKIAQEGKLKNRLYDCISLSNWKQLGNRRIKKATGDEMIRQGCVKYFSDGNRESITELSETIISADKADIQVMMHAIGEESNSIVLTIFENVLKQNGEKDRRFRIEHAYNFKLQDLRRFAAAKTIASMQPYLFFNGSGRDSRLFRQMLDGKVFLAFGSDANIIEMNPLLGIYAAVFGANSGNGMTVEEAVRAYTLDAAYAEFQENVKGSLTVGKLADFVVLSENIFTINPSRIEKVKVLQTIMNGKIVYTAE